MPWKNLAYHHSYFKGKTLLLHGVWLCKLLIKRTQYSAMPFRLAKEYNLNAVTILPSSTAFLTALKPSLIASLIWVSVCLFGPLINNVTERGWLQFSIKVNFSSPCVNRQYFQKPGYGCAKNDQMRGPYEGVSGILIGHSTDHIKANNFF